MKLPKSFHKHSDLAKREWVMLELKKVREREQELMKLSRLLASGNFKPLDYDRPDLDALKSE